MQNQLNNINQTLTDVNASKQKMYDVSILNGYWTSRYKLEAGQEGSEEIYIGNGAYYKVNHNGEMSETFKITDFIYDDGKKSMFFIKEDPSQRVLYKEGHLKFNFVRLRFQTADRLVGNENSNISISYTKKTT